MSGDFDLEKEMEEAMARVKNKQPGGLAFGLSSSRSGWLLPHKPRFCLHDENQLKMQLFPHIHCVIRTKIQRVTSKVTGKGPW